MILSIIESIIEGLLSYYFLYTLNYNLGKADKRTNSKIPAIIGAVCLGITHFIPKSIFPINTSIVLLIYFLTLVLGIKIKPLISFLQSLGFVIYMFLCECISIILLITFSKYSTTDEIANSLYGQIMIMGIYYAIYLLMLLLINFIFKNKCNILQLKKFLISKHFIIYLIIILITFIPQLILTVYNKYYYNPAFLIINVIQIIFISIYMVYSIYTYLLKERLKEELYQLEIDNKSMASLIDGVRTMKHDFNNIFQAIHGYLCTKDYEKLDLYVESVMKECNILNNITFLNRQIFDDPGIYGIVGVKQFHANNIGILFEIDVPQKVSLINFPKPLLCRSLGILLDNAIEATSKASEKYIKLEIHYSKIKNAFIIRILNTYDTSISIDLNKIYDKGYSSKKVKSGIGLWEVKKFISLNKNSQIFATVENNLFVQNIIIED